MELSAARARAVAIAATGAVAVFGSVAIQGAHGDLLKGLEGAARETERVHRRVGRPRRLLQPAATRPRSRRSSGARLERLPGVRAVRPVPQRTAGLRRAPRAGDRPAARSHAAAARRARSLQGNPRLASAARARRRLAGPLPGARRRTPPAHRPGVHAADPRPDDACASRRSRRTSAGRPARSS